MSIDEVSRRDNGKRGRDEHLMREVANDPEQEGTGERVSRLVREWGKKLKMCEEGKKT